ncbi:MAG: shikimate dehydrogenase [Sphaerochaetaceae bacterium]|nr:shikimate dehydrogenase [Sphaerochaetaceae bacterium]NLO60279.1 shikimate dehydrogenase [Spirochaetales bacterium]MDD2404900.1 shikimate dehydrogenase [Sphaerochaetaceae bacterium]MDD3670613.1 shikimate dehydrogenase [Sphaerochaetaceae bacterium]MDD4259404.1 shikimate dehydrogenase [Sphaerochaetaceae bacterium]
MICLVLTGSTIEENIQQFRENRSYLSIIELRLDLLDETERPRAIAFPDMVDVPVILTCRRVSDGGAYGQSERSRIALIEQVSKGNFAYVDLEEDVRRSGLEHKLTERNIRIIRSYHDFEGVPNDIYHRTSRIAAKGEIPKMAVTPKTLLDLIILFRIESELASVPEKIVLGMGDMGVPTRILYKRMGSMFTYCSEQAIAPGQIDARTMKELYKADKVDARTRIYGVIGNPVLHSSSPHIHNPGFQQINFNAVYVPFLVDSVRSFFVLAETLQISGFSVTVPHKQAVLPYLGKTTREVKQIGSCNTVVRTKNFWSGTNTDYYGFIEPLLPEIDAKNIQTALVIGAGGAARSVVWALRNHGCKVTIINRNVERARKLALETMSAYDSLENARLFEGVDLIVQTTTVGMVPDSDGDPIPDFHFTGKEIAYELVYKPPYTRFLTRASAAGCRLQLGMDMLIRQGKLQFEAFTGYHYPKRVETFK